MIGQTVSHYRVLEKLGEGGMGVVYLAEDTRLGRKVALKALSPEFVRDPDRRKRFQQEARAAAVLTHPGIATVYEFEEIGEDLFIAFEYVRGDNLRAAVNRGPMELNVLLKTATDIARALTAAHTHGVVHRDLKPENVIRTAEGDSKILDFGLARFQPSALESDNASTRLTDPGSIVGTISYMAPEQLESKDADFRSDIFSFGILVYELATGMRPFEGASRASTISRILSAEPVSLLQRNPVAPPELDRIVRKCLRKRPEERYQSTRDLAVDLESLRRDSESGISPRPAETFSSGAEDGLLRRPFAMVAPTPRRWWEANQLLYVVFNAVFIYIGWKVKEWTPGTLGLALFLAVVVLAAASTSFRVILLGTGVVTPANLAAEVRRLGRWTRLVDLTFTALLVVLAGTIVNSHPGVAGLLVGMAVAGLVAFLIIDPTLARAAFPQLTDAAVAPKDTPAATTGAKTAIPGVIVLLQAVYHGFAVYLLLLLEPQTGRDPIVEAFGFAITLGAGISAATGAQFWRGNVREAQRFTRWFLLYLLLDVVAMVSVLVFRWEAMKDIPIPVAVLIFAIPLYARWHQRQLASQLLGKPAIDQDAPAGSEQPAVAPSFRLISLIQLVYFLPVGYFVSLLAEVVETIPQSLHWAELAVTTFYLPGLVVTGWMAWRLWQGDREVLERFVRWFWIFLLVDLVAMAGMVAVISAYANLTAAIVVLPVLAYLPFFQRYLARKLLAG